MSRHIIILILTLVFNVTAVGQETNEAATADVVGAETATPLSEAPAKVNVEEVVGDDAIKARLVRILEATEWFDNPVVRVDEGVVFLAGDTQQDQHRDWATQLASKTEDVVAVVNRIKVADPPIWNLAPAVDATKDLGRNVVQSIPLIGIAFVLVALTWFAGRATLKLADKTVMKRFKSSLLREVARKTLLIPVWLVGIYLILRISGLTRLAMTVIGGTGVLGLVVGFAFRDIAENFLSSILISVQNPFRYGDLIQVDGNLGFVQRVNTRGTVLMTFDGNHIQIPNSTIYKNTIKNYTANPNRRFDFEVGIGYDVPVSEAQQAAFEILAEHPAILEEPEAQVLVEGLGSSTVNIRVYAWVDGSSHSLPKVKSSVIRLVKRRFEDSGYSMPDDAREIVFPEAVPIEMLRADRPEVSPVAAAKETVKEPPVQEEVATKAEGGLISEIDELHEQAKKSRDPEEGGADLLTDSAADGLETSREQTSTA